MYPRHGVLLGCALLTAGCVRDELVTCGDGRLCPLGTLCDEERATCIDPRGISAPGGAIDFGSIPCGSTGRVTLPLRNYGVSPIDFDASTTVSGVTVSPATGSIPPGDSVSIEITADLGGQSIPGEPIEGTLVLSTSYEIVERPLRVQSVGAVVMASSTVDFGEVQIGTVNPRLLVLRNTGNAAAEATLAPLATPFTSMTAPATRIEPGSVAEVVLSFRPTSIGTYTEIAQLALAGELCQPPPQEIALSGIATGEPILASQTLVDFGPTPCAKPAATKSITFTSNLPTDQTLTSTITGTNAEDYTPPPTTALPGNGAVTVEVQRGAISPLTAVGAKAATLTVTAAPSGTTKVIPLQHFIEAPVLTASTDALDFGQMAAGESKSSTILVSNSGNAPASVNAKVSELDGTVRLTVSPNPFQVPTGGSVPVTVSLQAGSPKELRDTPALVFEAGGQCSLAPRLTISATIK